MPDDVPASVLRAVPWVCRNLLHDVATAPGRGRCHAADRSQAPVRNILPSDWKKRIRHFLLDFDARIDSTLFSSAAGARELYERFSTFMDRFYVGRWKRWVFVEPLSEAATLGPRRSHPPAGAGAAGVPRNRGRGLAEEIRSRGHVPRPLRQPDRQPRHQAQRFDSARGVPDNLIKATLATEDRRFYDHFGIDVGGTFRALVTNAQAGGVRQGGSSITQQLAKNLFLSNERTIERKVNEAFLAVWLETH